MVLEKIQEKSKFYLLTDHFTKECGLIIKEMDQEFKYIQMEINMMDYGLMTKDKEGVNLLFKKKIRKKEF
jgi:hypothetical protein